MNINVVELKYNIWLHLFIAESSKDVANSPNPMDRNTTYFFQIQILRIWFISFLEFLIYLRNRNIYVLLTTVPFPSNMIKQTHRHFPKNAASLSELIRILRHIHTIYIYIYNYRYILYLLSYYTFRKRRFDNRAGPAHQIKPSSLMP